MLITILCFYVLLCVAGGALQRRMIYFPTKLSPSLAETMAKRAGLVPWKNHAGQLMGWKLPASGTSTGSVLVVHGNAGSAVDRDYFARPIHEAGSLDVYVLEYPGYGAREGSPSEKSFLSAADEAFALLGSENPIYVVSESLGTGVAAHLAMTHRSKVAGMVLFVPYNDFVQLAQTKMPILPVSLLLLDRFDPEDWLKDYSGPVKFILAEKDEIIPMKFGRKLHDRFDGPKNLQVVSDAYHNDVCVQSADWWRDVFLFWEQNRATGEKAIDAR